MSNEIDPVVKLSQIRQWHKIRKGLESKIAEFMDNSKQTLTIDEDEAVFLDAFLKEYPDFPGR